MTEPAHLPPHRLVVDVADMTDGEIEASVEALLDLQDKEEKGAPG